MLLFALALLLQLVLQLTFAFPNGPDGFIIDDVAGNLGIVTDFAILQGNTYLVTQKSGQLVLVQNGQQTVILDLSNLVGTAFGDRGLIAVEVHPQYPIVPFVYLAYVYDPNPGDDKGRKWNRLERYTLAVDGAGITVVPNSAYLVFGACKMPLVKDWYGDDCSPMHGTTHSIDWIRYVFPLMVGAETNQR
jgi:hypothetical protein